MLKRVLKIMVLAGALAGALAMSAISAQAASTVRFWYHFDNPDNPMDKLIAAFEKANPGITIKAENIPWNSYYDTLYTAIAGGNAPDAAMVKLFAQPRLVEMGALQPLDPWLKTWPGKADLLDNILKINAGPDGKQYYLPIQYVVLYLYYRVDLFKAAGLTPPKTCQEFLHDAQVLTHVGVKGKPDIYGFGLRGGKGGWDQWGSFVLSSGAKLDGDLLTPKAIAANQWVVDLYRKYHVVPPSAPNDGFQEIISAFQQGRTAMIIHHIGSSNDMVKVFGDRVSAVPVPECNGGRWTSYGDESVAIMSSAEDKEAAWKWISFLATGKNNVMFNESTGQMPVTKSGTAHWTLHQKRFVDATVASLPFAHTLPAVSASSDFVNTTWPTAMQRALTGEITAKQMLEEIHQLYATGK